jgi:cysteine desulfuration protein SufE
MDSTTDLPERMKEIIQDFSLCEGREKLELLLQFSENLPLLPDWLAGKENEMESVPECMTPVSVTAQSKDNHMFFYFAVPEESPTVSGYAAILAEGLYGASPEQVLNLPPDLFTSMGLEKVLSTQRMRGFSGLVAHLKRLAVEAMQKT